MKHFLAILAGIALALFGGALVWVNRHDMTTALLGAGFGAIGVGFALVIPAQFAQATQAAGAGVKALIAACPGVGPKDGAS